MDKVLFSFVTLNLHPFQFFCCPEQCLGQLLTVSIVFFVVGPLQRVRPRNGIFVVVLVVAPLRSEFIGEL